MGGGLFVYSSLPDSGIPFEPAQVSLVDNDFERNSSTEGGAIWVSWSSSVQDEAGNELPRPDTFNRYTGNSPRDIYYGRNKQ